LDLRSGEVTLVRAGDPEPTDVAVARNGNVYWTCTSAGVIVEPRRRGARWAEALPDRRPGRGYWQVGFEPGR
jgi:hypothetical protein